MPVIGVLKDEAARTLTITARFDAPIGRVWQVWSDPRQLERWWGAADLSRDGDGARSRGRWQRGLRRFRAGRLAPSSVSTARRHGDGLVRKGRC